MSANIAEGFGRNHFLDKAKFYLNARGSLSELKSHLLIAEELGVLKDGSADNVFQVIEQLSLHFTDQQSNQCKQENERDQ